MDPFDRQDFYSGLRELAESAFPKHCQNCGRVYATAAEFIAATEPVAADKSGLKISHDDDGKVILELFRNCVCGSTLMDTFNDRRGLTEAGAHKRRHLQELQDYLIGQGIDPARASTELRKVANGQASDILKEVTPPPSGRK